MGAMVHVTYSYNIFKPAVCVNFSASITRSELKKEALKNEQHTLYISDYIIEIGNLQKLTSNKDFTSTNF